MRNLDDYMALRSLINLLDLLPKFRKHILKIFAPFRKFLNRVLIVLLTLILEIINPKEIEFPVSYLTKQVLIKLANKLNMKNLVMALSSEWKDLANMLEFKSNSLNTVPNGSPRSL